MKKHADIILLNTDTGGVSVLKIRQDYDEKMKNIFSDNNIFEIFQNNNALQETSSENNYFIKAFRRKMIDTYL